MPDNDRQLTDAPRYTTLHDYMRVFRERWRLIAGFMIVFAAVAFAYSASQARIFEAEANLNARQLGSDQGLLGGSSGPPVSPQALTAELAAMAERDSIADQVKRSLGTPLSGDQIAARVSSSIDVQTNLVVLAARDEDATFAARLVNAYARQVAKEAGDSQRDQIDAALGLVRQQLKNAKEEAVFPGADQVTILQERFNRLQALKRITEPVQIVTLATKPPSPISPKPVRSTFLALLMGLFLGVIAAFVRDSLDTRLKTPREIEDHFGLTRIGQLSDIALGRSVLSSNGRRQLDPVDLEAARIMRTNLDFLGSKKPLHSLAVTSPLPGEGKSTVAVVLAWASAMAGRLTLLIECDMRQSVLADRLGLRASPGLSDTLLDRAAPQEVVQVVDLGSGVASGGGPGSGAGHLVCITAGTPVKNPPELLGSDRFKSLLNEVTSAYDLVVLDTSPMLAVVDTRELLPLVDGVVVCARSYQTTPDQAQATREALDQVAAPLAGLVVTGVRLEDDEYYGYYHGYAGSSSMQ